MASNQKFMLVCGVGVVVLTVIVATMHTTQNLVRTILRAGEDPDVAFDDKAGT